jgi:hypothetical protein
MTDLFTRRRAERRAERRAGIIVFLPRLRGFRAGDIVPSTHRWSDLTAVWAATIR